VTISFVVAFPDGSEDVVGHTIFIMVARDRLTGQAADVPPLKLASEEEKEWDRHGKDRAAARKESAKASLKLLPPRPDEVNVIHKCATSISPFVVSL
jgi:hypothetical protein